MLTTTRAATAPATPRPPRPRRRGRAAEGHALRRDIQGLRALAVLLVVLCHAGIGPLAGGYVGVDVFFVISGFVITSLLLREIAATGGISIRRFYARRALRLLPAATLVILATLAGCWLFLSRLRFTDHTGDALASLLYVENLRLASDGTDYLDEGEPPSPFQHFWSLAVEEQFYLMWPLLLLATCALTGRLVPLLARRRWPLGVPLAALALGSFWLGLSATGGSGSEPWAYFGTHTRLWELAAGALLALPAARLTRLPAAPAAAMTWCGLACVLLAALGFGPGTPFPGHHALLPVLGAVLLLAGGCAPAPRGAGRLLAVRPAVWLGGLSYGWYLWHWPLLLIGPEALGRPAGPRLSLALAALALLLAWATLHLVENPVRFHAALRGRPRRALAFGLGLTATATVFTLTAAAFPPRIETGPPAAASEETLAAATDPQEALAALIADSGARLPGNLTPPLADIKGVRSAHYRNDCHVGYDVTEPRPCVFGDASSDVVVVLFGDSHAAHWFPTLERLALRHGWKLVTMTKASCKVAAVTTLRRGEPYTACDEWRANALAAIADLRPDLVLASASEAGTPAQAPDGVRQAWREGFTGTFTHLRAGGAHVAYLQDTVWPGEDDAVECAAEHPTRLDACAGTLPRSLRDPARRDTAADVAGETGVSVIDPVPWLCTAAGHCPVVVGNTMVYRDRTHLSEGYARSLAPVLGDRLRALFGDLDRLAGRGGLDGPREGGTS